MIFSDAKLGDVISIFLQDNDEVSSRPTSRWITATVIAATPSHQEFMIGWKVGEKLPSYCQPRSGHLNPSYIYIPTQGEYTQIQGCHGSMAIKGIVTNGSFSSRECPCGIARVDCTYHKVP